MEDLTLGDCAIGEIIEIRLARGWTRVQVTWRDGRGGVAVRPLVANDGYENRYVHLTIPQSAPVRAVDSGVVFTALRQSA